MRRTSNMTFLILAVAGGCSLWMETNRPDYTDVSVVHKGTSRYLAAAALGKPVQSYKKDGKDVDVFQADPNGRYGGTKAAVTSFNAVADVLSIGMWEAVATPAELLTKHKLTTYVVTYTADQTVESIDAVSAPPKPQDQVATATNSPSASSSPATATAPPDAGETSDASGSSAASSSPTVAATPAAAPQN
jgi:hypothetical protein